MTRLFILCILIFCAGFMAGAQSSKLEIPFLRDVPAIDGLPDAAANSAEWRNFTIVQKTSEQYSDVAVRYKIGYNYSALYLLIESDSDSLICRDRAYQNGDGFHLVVAKPTADTTTREFNVLRFSPANRAKRILAQKGFWYYNVDLSGKGLGAATQFVCQSAGGKTYFELLLPWSEIPPYHPLFSRQIGLNLCFVKAIGQKEKNYYFLKYDERIQSEQSSRKYLLADFGNRDEKIQPFTQMQAERNNIQQNDSLRVRIVTLSDMAGSWNCFFALKSADNYMYTYWRKEISVCNGLTNRQVVLSTANLLPGGYKLVWKCSDNSEGEIPLTILPVISLDQELNKLAAIKSKISDGDYTTLLFAIRNLTSDYEQIKAYETAGNIRERFAKYRSLLKQLAEGKKTFDTTEVAFRRAFVSGIDQTLQPYSNRLPKGFDRSRKYPLFVMLHGSGSDDQNMLDPGMTNESCIEIAPNGRGTSNCFTADGAEVDVKEAIDDAIRNYPVDEAKIIIGGFSMGGYGAYRLFYEYPHLFKAVAVFSGNPSLANKWIGEGYPDFLDMKYLKPFRNIPVFIYHSKNDLNCPYDLTLQLIEKLNKAGAKTNFVTSEESGHVVLNKEQEALFRQWLAEQTGENGKNFCY